MSLQAEKTLGSELDRSLNTLTDVVRIVGETRVDVKVLDSKIDRLEQKVDTNQQENRERFNQQDAAILGIKERFDQQDKNILEIKETLGLILSKLPTN